jgi:hypothetical protein
VNSFIAFAARSEHCIVKHDFTKKNLDDKAESDVWKGNCCGFGSRESLHPWRLWIEDKPIA